MGRGVRRSPPPVPEKGKQKRPGRAARKAKRAAFYGEEQLGQPARSLLDEVGAYDESSPRAAAEDDLEREMLSANPSRTTAEWDSTAYLAAGSEDPSAEHFVQVLRRAATLLNRLPVERPAR